MPKCKRKMVPLFQGNCYPCHRTRSKEHQNQHNSMCKQCASGLDEDGEVASQLFPSNTKRTTHVTFNCERLVIAEINLSEYGYACFMGWLKRDKGLTSSSVLKVLVCYAHGEQAEEDEEDPLPAMKD